MKKLPLVLAALAGFLAMILLLYAAVGAFAFSTASYPQEPPYDAMAVDLAEYLSGRRDALSEALFTERERLHMVDVQALFQGGKTLAVLCLCFAVFLGNIAFVRGGRRALGRGVCIGMGVFLGLVAFLGVWAAIDFNGWFTVMHELIFTNDLWLLDPAESMLIRMLPLEFFIGAVQTIAIRFGISALALLVIALLLQRRPHGLPD